MVNAPMYMCLPETSLPGSCFEGSGPDCFDLQGGAGYKFTREYGVKYTHNTQQYTIDLIETRNTTPTRRDNDWMPGQRVNTPA